MVLVTATINRITMTLNVLGTLLIAALMILICADVIGRVVFLSPISGVPEMVSLSIVAIVFLQAPEAFRMGRFTRSEAILNFLGRKSRRARAFLEVMFASAAIVVIGVLFYASAPFFVKSWERGTFVGAVGDFIAPVWPVKLIILVGCVALLAQLMLYLIGQIYVLMGKNYQSAGNEGSAF